MSNTNFELKEHYPLKPEVDMTHDLSRGLNRHFPIEYDRLGRYREPKPVAFPIGFVFVVVCLVLAKVVL